jgi:hypothetical protein
MEQDFNREKYLSVARSSGLNAAVTQLHQDLWELEYQCFENPNGFNPSQWKVLNHMRIFSRELWDLKLKPQTEW